MKIVLHHRRPVILSLVVAAGILGLVIVARLQTAQKLDSGMKIFVAQEAFRQLEASASQGYRSPEGAVIAQIEPESNIAEPDFWREAFHFLVIWKYDGGILQPATERDVEKVKKEKNSFLVLFVVRRIENEMAFVDVATFYPKSSTPGFGDGGYASHWQLRYSGTGWILESKEDYTFWD